MCLVNKATLIKREELPKFNGKSVKDIYAVYENSRHTKEGYIADILYYNVYYHPQWEDRYKQKRIMVKELPADFHFMGKMIENKGSRVFIRNLSFRESDSANGSFTDESMDINGWAVNSTSGTFNLYRAEPYMEEPENSYVVDCGSELGKAMLNILNKEYEVEEVEFWQCGAKMEEGSLDFATKYPYEYTPIQVYDGLVYPDEKLPSWRWLHGMPYRVPTDADPKDRTFIRVWDNDNKEHVYLTRATDIEVGDEGLVDVSFSYKQHDIYGVEGNAYCHIRRYNKDHDYEFVSYKVLEILKDGIRCEVTNSKSGKRKETVWHGGLYRVTRRFSSNEKNFYKN